MSPAQGAGPGGCVVSHSLQPGPGPAPWEPPRAVGLPWFSCPGTQRGLEEKGWLGSHASLPCDPPTTLSHICWTA